MYVLCIMYIDLYRMYINKMGPFTSDGDTESGKYIKVNYNVVNTYRPIIIAISYLF